MQRQMSLVVAGQVNKEREENGDYPGPKHMEKAVKANVDAFWACHENAMLEKAERERMQQLTSLSQIV